EMVTMKAVPVNPLHLPKVVVSVDGTVGVSPPHRLPDYMGPPWRFIEVDWAGLKLLRAPAPATAEPPPKGEKAAETETTRWARDPVIAVAKRLFPPDGRRPKSMSIRRLTIRFNKELEFKENTVSEDTVDRAFKDIEAALQK